jgi:hypothetical protein
MPTLVLEGEFMSQASEDKAREIASWRIGVLVTIIAIALACTPLLSRALLRTTVPPLRAPVIRDGSPQVRDFYDRQLKDLYQKALTKGEALDASAGTNKSRRNLADSYRENLTLLNDLHSHLEQGYRSEIAEMTFAAEALQKNKDARQSAERRAQHLNNVRMTAFTLVGAIFLVLVVRSRTVPTWAQRISMMAGGVILAGWFPL